MSYWLLIFPAIFLAKLIDIACTVRDSDLRDDGGPVSGWEACRRASSAVPLQTAAVEANCYDTFAGCHAQVFQRGGGHRIAQPFPVPSLKLLPPRRLMARASVTLRFAVTTVLLCHPNGRPSTLAEDDSSSDPPNFTH